jgi:hypothetical protein
MDASDALKAAVSAAPIARTTPLHAWGPVAYGVWSLVALAGTTMLKGFFPYVKLRTETKATAIERLTARIESLETKLDTSERDCAVQIQQVRNEYEVKLEVMRQQFRDFQDLVLRAITGPGGIEKASVIAAILGGHHYESRQPARRNEEPQPLRGQRDETGQG